MEVAEVAATGAEPAADEALAESVALTEAEALAKAEQLSKASSPSDGFAASGPDHTSNAPLPLSAT